MKHLAIATLLMLSVIPARAEEHRELGAHEHGVGHLDIAFEGSRISIELEVPGADIVGFEHAAESAEDRAALERAVAVLAKPLELFVLPEAAQCTVTQAAARFVDEDHEGADHGGEEHAGEAHGHEAGHAEFHAQYELACAEPGAITRIDFAYFTAFANARELEIQLVSEKGAKSFEVERGAPVLELEGLI